MNATFSLSVLLCLSTASMLFCGDTESEPNETPDTKEAPMALSLHSTAFAAGEAIPKLYSCDGTDVSPPLKWEGAPEGTQCFALIMDDPDAPVGTWDHWVVINLPATTDSLPQAASSKNLLPGECYEGINSWGRTDYGGPCPPGGTHRYFFRLYALDKTLGFAKPPKKADVLSAAEGHIRAQAELMGTFSR